MVRKTIKALLDDGAPRLNQSNLAIELNVSRSTIIKYKDDTDTNRHEIREKDLDGNFELMVKVGNKK